ncbi:MAG: 2OG-Fe(II) oxygenase [Sphingomonas bacterium]|nr:2OG-Fe(II) oxygenase [Sphingomonas bacterium]
MNLEAFSITEPFDAASEHEAASLRPQVMPAHLPTLDISRLRGSVEERAAVARELRTILHDHGFFYLSGHGVDPALVAEVLEVSKRFFALPESDKMEIAMIGSPQFRGYTRAGAELTQGRPDWREQVDFDCEEEAPAIAAGDPAWKRTIGPNQWPSALPELKATILRYQAEVTRVGLDVLKAVAVALGEDEEVFAPMLQPQPRQHLKILRYPGRDSSQCKQGVGAHKDGGLITILLQDELPGLSVQNQDGSWVDAPPIPGTFVVNTGELLELATNGFVRADVHAATAPPLGMERFSIPFFLGAAHEGVVPLIQLLPELKRAERGVSTDPENPLLRGVGANHLKARLRSHPDVARAHYADLL